MQARETYTYGNGRMSYLNNQTGDSYQYLTNQSGSVTGLTKDGQAVASTSYNLYGSTKESSDETGNPFAYNGEARDVTGLDYLRARYYDSQVGTFLTEDSYSGELTDPLSQNLYSYVQNNPVNYTDPSGHLRLGMLGGGGRRKTKSTKVYPIFSSDTPVVTRVAIINNQPLAKSTQKQQIHAVRTGQPGIWNPTRPAYSPYLGYVQRPYTPVSPTSRSYQQYSIYRPIQTVQTALQRAQASGQSTYNWSKSRLKEAANIHRNWTNALEKTIRHVCNPKTAKGKDGGQNKKAIISAAQFKQIDEASRHGLTVEEKDKIDKMSLGELTSKYPYLNNVSPYQGYSSLNARERDYIISRYQQLLQKSRPKPPSILDDPSYAYYSAIARTGIDPITGKKVSPAEIANAKLQMNVLAVAPIVQSVVAGWAFGKQQNGSGNTPAKSNTKPVESGKSLITADEIKFSDKFSKPGYQNQVTQRGWSNQKIADAINNPTKTSTSYNEYTGGTVTNYYINDTHYVAVDNSTGKVIQVSNLYKSNWKGPK